MLERERGVVQNEKRQGENQPYAKAFAEIAARMYPYSHPYSWTTIGSMEDLNAASLDDVKNWYKTYYGPNNVVMSLAGDITPEQALALVTKYFGDIPPGPALVAQKNGYPRLTVTSAMKCRTVCLKPKSSECTMHRPGRIKKLTIYASLPMFWPAQKRHG
jgi:predicted Zn-dependent peptidase